MSRVVLCVIAALMCVVVQTAPAFAVPIYIDTVVAITPGAGAGVDCSGAFGAPYVGPCGAGTFSLAAITGLDGISYALGGGSGTAGSIVVAFSTGQVVDAAGADLRFYDGFGANEGFVLAGSVDGIVYTAIGTFPGTFAACPPAGCIIDVDLAGSGLATASFFRVTAHQPTSVFAFPEAYDLDTIEALNFRETGAAVPEPATLLLVGTGVAAAAARKRSRRRQ
jgi:hypothetical protein